MLNLAYEISSVCRGLREGVEPVRDVTAKLRLRWPPDPRPVSRGPTVLEYWVKRKWHFNIGPMGSSLPANHFQINVVPNS